MKKERHSPEKIIAKPREAEAGASELAQAHPRYGYRRTRALRRREGGLVEAWLSRFDDTDPVSLGVWTS